MSDETRPRWFPAWRWVALAVMAGALAGAIAVYVSGGSPGNTAALGLGGYADADDSCPEKAGRARTIATAATGDVAALAAADPPRSLAALGFYGPDGKHLTLGDKAGKTILLNLWATWCAPCRAEMPALDALQKDAGDAAFEVVAVNVDTGDDVKPKRFLAETEVEELTYYTDHTLGLFNELKKRGLALGLPATLLIDPEGCLLAHMNGPAEWSGQDARVLIAKAVDGS